MPAADDLQTAQLRTARVQAAQDSFRSERGDITRAGHDVVDPLAAGSVGRERHAVIVKRMTPRIDEPASKHFESHGLRAELPNAPRVQPPHAVRSLDVAVDVNRLIHVEHSVRPPPQRVQNVVSVLGAEPRQHDSRFIRLAVTVGVLEMQQLGARRDIRPAVARLDAGRDQQPIREHRRLVRAAVAVNVLQHQNLVVRFLPRSNLRINLRRRDPETPPRIKVHLNRLVQQRIGREQIHLKAIGHDERLPLDLRIRIGDVLEFSLSESRRRAQSE